VSQPIVPKSPRVPTPTPKPDPLYDQHVATRLPLADAVDALRKPETSLREAIRSGLVRRMLSLATPERTIETAAYRCAATVCALALFDQTPDTMSLTDDHVAFDAPVTRDEAEEIAIALLAGGAAVRRFIPGSQRDIGLAAVEAARVVKPFLQFASLEELQMVVRDMTRVARALINEEQFWDETEALAAELMTQIRVAGDDITRVIRGVHRA
jgi:hypothetical protein